MVAEPSYAQSRRMPTPSLPYALDPALIAVGNAVRAARLARGISQEDLANRAQLDRSHMGSLERARQNPSLITLVRICAALDMSVAELMSEARL